MKLSFICPTKWIVKYQGQGDFILGLSHLMDRDKENEYEKAILEAKLPIILDNGNFENHKPEGIDSLIAKAVRLKATHFFAPDYLYNAALTLEALANACYIYNQLQTKDVKIAAVVQADNEKDYLDLYNEFQEIPEVDLIGLSILAIPRCFGEWNKDKHYKKDVYIHNDEEITRSRKKLLKILLQKGKNKKKCHLLGLGNSYEDIIFARRYCPWIVSNDTSCCFQSGLFNKKLIGENLEVEGGKAKEKVNFDLKEITPEQEKLIQYNINLCKRILKK